MTTTQYGTLTIVGSSHISGQSIREIGRIFKQTDPAVIALELDRRRFTGLKDTSQKPSYLAVLRQVGLKGFLFTLLGGWVQRKLGKMVGVEPGSEMLAAADLAEKQQKRIALIDRDITVSVSRLKAITWAEKWTFIKEIIQGLLGKRRQLPFDPRKVPSDEIVKVLLAEVQEKYPTIHRVLIHERNVYMARKLARLMRTEPDTPILAVVGAGHVEGLLQELQRILEGKDPAAEHAISFSYSIG